MLEVHLFTSWSNLGKPARLRKRSRLEPTKPREVSLSPPGRFLKLAKPQLLEQAICLQLRRAWVGSLSADAALDIAVSGRYEEGRFKYHVTVCYIDLPVFEADFATERAWDFARLREEVFFEDQAIDQMKSSFEVRIRQEKVLWYLDCHDAPDKPNPFFNFRDEIIELRRQAELLFMESFAACAQGAEPDYEIQAKIVEFLGTTGVCVISPACMNSLVNLGLRDPAPGRLRKVLARCMSKKTWLLKNIVLSGYYGSLAGQRLSESAKAKFAYLQRFVDFVYSESPDLEDLVYFFQATADRLTLDELMTDMCDDEEVLPVFFSEDFLEAIKLDCREGNFREILTSEEFAYKPAPPENLGDPLDFLELEEPAPCYPGCWWRQKNDCAARLARSLVKLAAASEDCQMLLDPQGRTVCISSNLTELSYYFLSDSSDIQVSNLGTSSLMCKATTRDRDKISSLKLSGLKAIYQSDECLYILTQVLPNKQEEKQTLAKVKCCALDISKEDPLPTQLDGLELLEVDQCATLLFAFDRCAKIILSLAQYPGSIGQKHVCLSVSRIDGKKPSQLESRQGEILPILQQVAPFDPANEAIEVHSVFLFKRLAMMVIDTIESGYEGEQPRVLRRRMVCCKLRESPEANIVKPMSVVDLRPGPEAQFFLLRHKRLPVIIQLSPKTLEYHLISAANGRLSRLRGVRRLEYPLLSDLTGFGASGTTLTAIANTFTGVLAKELLVVMRWRLKV